MLSYIRTDEIIIIKFITYYLISLFLIGYSIESIVVHKKEMTLVPMNVILRKLSRSSKLMPTHISWLINKIKRLFW